MIDFWMIFVVVSVAALIVEILVPTLFCINFAFAGIITAIISVFWGNLAELITIFLVLSLLSIIFIKPVLEKLTHKEKEADFDSQYKGQVVKAIEPITTMSGAVTIFDERWEARLLNPEIGEIPAGSNVVIVSNKSTILYVKNAE